MDGFTASPKAHGEFVNDHCFRNKCRLCNLPFTQKNKNSFVLRVKSYGTDYKYENVCIKCRLRELQYRQHVIEAQEGVIMEQIERISK